MTGNRLLSIITLAYLLPWPTLPFDAANGIFSTCRQLVVVVSPNNSSIGATMYKFEKNGKKWQQAGSPHPVNLGKKGLAWGKGLQSAKKGVQKKEGDQKSPEGIFRFGSAFGYAQTVDFPLKIPYLPITETDICIEDSNSRFYNQIVDANKVPVDWKSRESMLREDEQYKWGIFVKQNLPPEPEHGSCIFFHIWRVQGSGTLGCTAMAEDDLLSLMQWLDPRKEPLLMQMTEADYRDYRKKFLLPSLSESSNGND